MVVWLEDMAGDTENEHHNTPCPLATPAWSLENSRYSLHYRLDYSIQQGGRVQWGGSPWALHPWKSIQEVQQIFRTLRVRLAIYNPIFEGPDWATFTAGRKAKIIQPTPKTHFGTLISMRNPDGGQNIYDVGQSAADLGETDKSQERPETERELKKSKGYSNWL